MLVPFTVRVTALSVPILLRGFAIMPACHFEPCWPPNCLGQQRTRRRARGPVLAAVGVTEADVRHVWPGLGTRSPSHLTLALALQKVSRLFRGRCVKLCT
jgi:hypothetical protein